MDRDERLKSAKEKLKKFQKKRQNDTATPSSVEEEEGEKVPNGHFVADQSEEAHFFMISPGENNVSVDQDEKMEGEEEVEFIAGQSPPLTEQISGVLSTAKYFEGDFEGDDHDMVLLKSRLTQVEREKQELATSLQQHAASLQQWEVHCQQITDQLNQAQTELEYEKTTVKEAWEKEKDNLKDQLRSHAESIKILVSEKTELEASLKKSQQEVREQVDQVKSLRTKYSEQPPTRASGLRPSPRERTCACTDRVFLAEVERKRLADAQVILREERDRLKIDNIDLKQEVMELKSKVDYRERESIVIVKQLVEATAKLEMAELNLAQLRSASSVGKADDDDDDSEEGEEMRRRKGKTSPMEQVAKEKDQEIVRLASENEEHVKRVAELTAYIQQASQDREQIIHQYTSYSQQLAAQIESLTQQVNVKAAENHSLAARETDLLEHVQKLEGQLQTLIQGSSGGSNDNKANLEMEMTVLRNKVAELDKKVLDLQEERDQLQEDQQSQVAKLNELATALVERDASISDLETQLEMAKDTGAMVDLRQQEGLVAACESDKVAASRAMKQNQQLKDQLEELELAVISLTNSKVQLAHELDNLRAKHAITEEAEATLKMEVKGLTEGVNERERNLNRMRDQMKYYIAFAENSINGHLDSGPRGPNTADQERLLGLTKELEEAKEAMRCLRSHNSELKSQLEVLASRTRDNSSTSAGESPERDEPQNSTPTPSTGSSASPIPPTNYNEQDRRPPSSSSSSTMSSSNQNNNNNSLVNHVNLERVPPMSEDVAILKLEQKFKQAMQRIAELTADKDNLEHLVVRLQEETDTVGEYITIYQYQRSQQKARLEEKEKQLQTVSRDREELKAKLAQLQSLVTSFVGDKTEPDLGQMAAADEVAQEAIEVEESAATERLVEPGSDTSTAVVSVKDEKAGRILALISEIGTNEMLSSEQKKGQDFHPWFWDHSSGKLVTV